MFPRTERARTQKRRGGPEDDVAPTKLSLVIPHAETEIVVEVPGGDLWLPDFEELDSDGFGYFHDKWMIAGLRDEEVNAVLGRERELLTEADQSADTAEEFDALCSRLETPDDDIEDGLGGLEIGVAGLTYVLNRLGAGTSASCRGHVGPRAWTRRPVVYFAAERPWAVLIEATVARGACGLSLSENGLLMIWGASVRDTQECAADLWSRRVEFASLGESAFHRWAASAEEW